MHYVKLYIAENELATHTESRKSAHQTKQFRFKSKLNDKLKTMKQKPTPGSFLTFFQLKNQKFTVICCQFNQSV